MFLSNRTVFFHVGKAKPKTFKLQYNSRDRYCIQKIKIKTLSTTNDVGVGLWGRVEGKG